MAMMAGWSLAAISTSIDPPAESAIHPDQGVEKLEELFRYEPVIDRDEDEATPGKRLQLLLHTRLVTSLPSTAVDP